MKLEVVMVDLEIPPRAKRWAMRLAVPAVVLSVATVAFAAPVTFTTNETLTASDLNNNVGYLVPVGAVMYFNLATCPVGWTEVTAAQGRYIVGLPTSGTLGGTVGTALTDEENRAVGQHTHGLSGSTAPEGTALNVDDKAFGYTGSGAACTGVSGFSTAGCYDAWNEHTHGVGTLTVGSAGAVAGTNAPYVQFLVCQKD